MKSTSDRAAGAKTVHGDCSEHAPWCELLAPFSPATLDEPPRRWPIRTIDGRTIEVLCRDSTKHIWWERPDGRCGLGGVSLADLPLEGSERLRGVPMDVAVVGTEGPKDGDAVRRAGFVCVASVTGAGLVPSAASLAVLADRVVVLWADADAVGRRHMAAIGERLAGVAREVRFVDVDDLADGAGAADLPAGEIRRRILAALARR